ncbi:asparagine synthase-related protein [Hyphococcus sp.]|jgi:asparagine synthase (glutamine-hydrolysing)|uniref:asparagine synthase-related protein n=1 Tax=Hyphococcus sp. TaxID=2038636 RepID=UPI003D0E4031
MLQFITIVHNASDSAAGRDASALRSEALDLHPDWRIAFEAPGLVIIQKRDASLAHAGVLISDRGGYVAGALFERDDGAGVPRAVTALDARRITGRTAERLFDDYWGSYVGFVRDCHRNLVHVARTPSGSVTCYYGKRSAAYTFFSNPKDGARLSLDNLEPDWGYILRRVCNNRFRDSSTGVLGVREIAPGEIVTVGQDEEIARSVWSLASCARREPIANHAAAGEALRTTVDAATAALATAHGRICVRLSGGLDSSIILSSLAKAGADIRAITYATTEPDGEERSYARAVADRYDVSLTEIVRDPSRARLREIQHPLAIRPCLWIADAESEEIEADFAAQNGVGAYFGGRGGDIVLYRSRDSHATTDLLEAKGFGVGWLRELWRTAARRNCAPWVILQEVATLRREQRNPEMTPWAPDYLTEEGRQRLRAEPVAPDHLPIGKRRHVQTLEDRCNYYDCFPYADYVYPLVSQPVIETALRIPSYILSPDGDDRRLAREAFRQRLPDEVYRRRSKGGTGNYLIQMLMQERRFLTDYLAGGLLAEQGVLDSNKMAAMLRPQSLMTVKNHMMEIVGAITVEAWLRTWTSARASKRPNEMHVAI